MIKIFEMFSGYGGASFALKKSSIPFECVGYSEIDKYACQCYEQNHKGKNFGDCKTINPDEIPDFDLLTGGFPCQDVSLAGKRDLSKGRTNLYLEILRIAKHKQPKYMLLENVKGLLSIGKSDKIGENKLIDKIIRDLKEIGYVVVYKVLNSKDYDIPQNRERIWFVCFRKDIYVPFKFQFPEKEELKIFIKDILEDEVDPKYYLSKKLQERFKDYLEKKKDTQVVNLQERSATRPSILKNPKSGGTGIIGKSEGIAYSLDTGNTQAIIQKDNLIITGLQSHQSIKEDGISNALPSAMGEGGGHTPMVYDRKGFCSRTEGFKESELSPTLSTKMGTGGNNVPMIIQKDKIDCVINTKYRHSFEDFKGYDNISVTLKSTSGIGNQIIINNLRRLTPKECFRLMGFLNDEINLNNLSDTQCYKLAGNGWDINIVSKIFNRLFK